jgi:hypothetical protein
MTTTLLIGYIVRETEAAVAFVANASDTKPLWLPRTKIAAMRELDLLSVKVNTAQDGERVGIPYEIDADSAFLVRIGLTA